MKSNYNLTSGFLFLYDWLPMIERLSGDEFKALFEALVARQKDDTPIPPLEGELTRIFAAMIEPTIKRRLEGQKAGLKSKALAEKSDLPKVPPVPSKAEQSKEKQSRAVYLSGTATSPRDKAARRGGGAAEKHTDRENFDEDTFFKAALVRSYGFDPREGFPTKEDTKA